MTTPSIDPAMAEFALLDDPDSPTAYFGIPVGRNLAEMTRYAWGEAQPVAPVRIERHMGRRKPGDVIWIDVGKFVVSSRVIAVLAGFTGWSSYPVEVYDGRGEYVPGYAGLGITGRCGPTRSDLTRVEGEGTRAEYVGLWFSLATWDGSDIFFPAVGQGPVVTARLGMALRRARIGNLRIVPLPEYRENKPSIDWIIASGKGGYAANVEDPPFR